MTEENVEKKVDKSYPNFDCKCNDCGKEWGQSSPKGSNQVCNYCGSANIVCTSDPVG